MTTPAILAIDGGGTSCRAVLCDQNGVELGSATGAFANLITDFETSHQHLTDVINAVYAAASRTPGDKRNDVAVLGIAGAEIGGTGARIAETFDFAGIRVLSDRDIAVAGIVGDSDGTLAQIGTGSFFAQKRGSTTRFVGGWGLALGDEASGAWLGRELLRRILLAHDGLVARTALTQTIMEQFGDNPDDIVLFASTALPGDYAALVPLLFDALADQDPVARHVVGLGLASLETILTSLEADNGGDLFVTGGVGDRYRPLLSERFQRGLSTPNGDSLSGAIGIGRAMLAP